MRALVLLGASMLVGCILVVSPEEYGSTCRFSGEDTQCGKCIAARCRSEVDQCCRDEACDSTMADVDDCAKNRTAGCTSLATRTGGLPACIARECSGACEPLTGTAKTSCREPRLGEGSTCTCSAAGEVNDFVCNTNAFPNTVCCQPDGWPAAGLACSCRALSCRPSDDGCFCDLADFTPKESECNGVHCCIFEDTCSCGSRECRASEKTVESCRASEIRCLAGQVRVEACSVRAL